MKGSVKNDKKGDLAYYLTLFKIEGHTTFRLQMHSTPEGFDKEWASGINRPTITERKVMRVDRITGAITESK